MIAFLLKRLDGAKECKGMKGAGNRFRFLTLAVVLLFTFGYSVGYAQKLTIRGTVYDGASDPKKALVGATVTIVGGTTGTNTDINGKYTITVNSPEDILEFQFMGYESQQIKAGIQTQIDVVLQESSVKINELVVTALGIAREEKSLGYAVSKVDGDQLAGIESGNWLNSLNGKVAGLNMDTSSSGPAGSIRVTLRGESSLSHDNNTALFVVDGVPVNSSMDANANTSSYESDDAPIDYGNGAGDFNPDDIESVSVLKGPAATALYGSRAANGAIVITTKAGKKNKGLGITFSSNVVLEKAGFWPNFQNEYGAGSLTSSIQTDGTVDGANPYEYSFWTITADKSDTGKKIIGTNSRYQFGEKIEPGKMRYLYRSYDRDSQTYTRLPFQVEDWFKGFFRTGVSYTNSLSVDAGDGKGQSLRVSFKDVRNSWIVPNTGYNTQNISVSMSSHKNKYIEAQAKITYLRKNSDNLPLGGYSNSTPLKSLMWKTPAVSVEDMYNEYKSGRITQHFEEDSNIRLIDATMDNPYAICYEHLNTQSRDRLYGNVSITGHIIPKVLSLTVRSGIDFSNDFRTQQKPYYTMSYAQGMYREQTIRKMEINTDFLLSFKKTFGNGISLNASFGGNNMVNSYHNISMKANMLDAKNLFLLSNVKGQLVTQSIRRKKSINSLYGFVSFGYRDMFYIDVTGRNDWSSTLAPGNNSYFYPSVGASVLLSEIFRWRSNTDWVDLVKLRGSWANVGNDTDPYQLINAYATNGVYNNSYELAGSLKNYNLKPENVASWEVGLETRLFKGKWGFDIAYYDSRTTNQIISVPSDWITGAASTMINAGEVRNRGIEISTDIRPLNKKNWKMNISLNWSKNWNKLVSLASGVDVWQLNDNTIGQRVMIYAYPGTELGRIYGVGYERAPQGAFYYDENGTRVDCSNQVIVDARTGNPKLAENPIDLGSIYPDWKAGMNFSLRYKTLSVSASFIASYGGRAYSLTNAIFSYMGKLKNSLEGRYEGLIHPGVNQNEDGTFVKNNTITTDIVDYYNVYVWNRNNIEQNTFDTSYLKMKDLRVEYSLPKRLCDRSRVFQGITFGFFMTNVFCITNFPQYDPEVASIAGSSLYRGVETGNYPMTRSYGFNIKLKF